jgi:hypothetical protein
VNAFISYSTQLDQIIALRLQTMAAVYGIRSYVPPADTRQVTFGELRHDVLTQLQQSDVVLAIITHAPTGSAIQEMDWALKQGVLLPIIGVGVPPQFYSHFPQYFLVDPSDPSNAERGIVNFLAQKQRDEASRKALLALATLGVSLLVLGALTADQ